MKRFVILCAAITLMLFPMACQTEEQPVVDEGVQSSSEMIEETEAPDAEESVPVPEAEMPENQSSSDQSIVETTIDQSTEMSEGVKAEAEEINESGKESIDTIVETSEEESNQLMQSVQEASGPADEQ
ncbi:MAG: hypothetical protein R6U50_02755 [Desulfobacterales bacterium]